MASSLDGAPASRDVAAPLAEWLAWGGAVVLALPSLAYAYGRDQALFDYVGSGWLDGRQPYVDAFDNKPPGIFLLHAALGWTVGPAHPFAIRAVEIVAVLAIGAMLGRVLAAIGERATRLGGVCALITSAFYFTCFDYWDTAQVELWEGGFLVAGLWAALAIERPLARCALAGASLGAAVLFKLPAVAPGCAVALVALAGRELVATGRARLGWSQALGRALALAAGAAVVAGAGLAPFLRSGTLGVVREVVIEFNAHYAASKVQHVMGMGAFWLAHAAVAGVTLAGLCLAHVALAFAKSRRDVVRAGLLVVGMRLAAIASVALQRKYYPYHWGVTAPFFGLAAGWAVARTARSWNAAPAAIGAVWAATMLVAAPRWPSNPAMDYARFSRALAVDLAGGAGLATLRPFVGMAGFDHDASARLGRIVRDRAESGDTLCVSGFEPVPYVVSGLQCPSRFFADHPLRDPALAFRREAWSAEHSRALRGAPPDWIIVEHDRKRLFGLDLRDYERVASDGALVLLHREATRVAAAVVADKK